MSGLLSELTSVASTLLGISGQAVNLITSHDILKLPIYASIAGLGVGLVIRLIRSI